MKVIIKNNHDIEKIIKEGCQCLRQDKKIYWGMIEITNKDEYKKVITDFFKHKIHKGYSINIITPFVNTKRLCHIIDNA